MAAREDRDVLRETKAVAEQLDPGWVRRDRRERAALAIAGILAIGAIVVAIIAIFVSEGAKRDVHNFIQKTPCAVAPASNKCAHVKEQLAKKGSLKSPCIEHQRVTGERGANCPQFYIPKAERETGSFPGTTRPSSTAPTSTTATAGPTAIAPSSGKTMPHGHAAVPHHQGGTKAPIPKQPPKAEPAPAGLPPPATSTTPSSGNETTATVTPPAEGSTGEGTGTTTTPSQGVLGTAGSTLGGAVEQLTETTGTAVDETGKTVGGVVKGLTGGE